jgi:hypothetical protein
MPTRLTFFIGSLLLCHPGWAQLAYQERYVDGYANEDATGAHVIGCWKFDGAFPMGDATGKGNDIKLDGALLNAEGRFGQSLDTSHESPVQTKRHAAMIANSPVLSPQGPFSMEMWIRLKPGFNPALGCGLLDKKDVDPTDYQWQLGPEEKPGLRRMLVTLGFGSASKVFSSAPIKLSADAWQHLAFTYDAAGHVTFHFNGRPAGSLKLEGCGKITPGAKPLSIGDNLGHYASFPGSIDEVRISNGVLNYAPLAIQFILTRQVWQRMEANNRLYVDSTNLRRDVMAKPEVRLALGDTELVTALPDLNPVNEKRSTRRTRYTMDTTLKPGKYVLRATVQSGEHLMDKMVEFHIMPRPVPRMPLVMLDAGPDDFSRLREMGFTHFKGFDNEDGAYWKGDTSGPPSRYERRMKLLDDALANELRVSAMLSPVAMLADSKLNQDDAHLRLDRSGKPYPARDISALNQDFVRQFEDIGKQFALRYAAHPALNSVMINEAARVHTEVSFNPVDVADYRKISGSDIPPEVVTKSGVDWTQLPGFPADRVIADDHPIRRFYHWFWIVGDGWNGLHSAMSKGLKGAVAERPDIWTLYDSSLEQPGISGAGGQVDVLANPAGTYPEPLRTGMCADQLAAMNAAGDRHQKIMLMTGLAWDRSKTAPSGDKEAGFNVSWEMSHPDASAITIAPMPLREAFWTAMARPIQGIMFKGWQELSDVPDSDGIRHQTNPDAEFVLKELIHEVVEPLGTSLMLVPDAPADVVLLQSFTSQMFAGRSGYGDAQTWTADLWLAMQHAHVQTDILFEETLLRGGLEGRKVLLMPECDVLTKDLVSRIIEWQKKGGKIIADEFLCPAIKADVTLPSFKRTNKAQQDKAKVLELAQTIPAHMQTLGWSPGISCDNPEIIVRTRRYGDALYVFVVNDFREPGNYVGQHGLMMENGLPSTGVLTLHQDSANVYDLTRGSFVLPKRSASGDPSWQVDLGPCDGRIFMVTPKPLLGIQLEVPESVNRGGAAALKVSVTTTQDSPMQAVIPVEIQIRDANGRPAEASGNYAAENGVVGLNLDIAPNEAPGTWEIRVRERASGMQVVKWLRIVR